jgi:hypothetical protein
MVTPVDLAKDRYALVTHIDITERALAASSLQEQIRQHQLLAAELGKERERLMTAQAVAKVGSWRLKRQKRDKS